ncbi:flagellar biosynthesis protein FlgA [Aquibaculum arenosum]|uniref:Flagellar biosynthesis protein FlgA n=1 Tax=Aquibaculum arenosum TaxID=3032591 RepID=A0ABT5YNA9_9PROT|nr:flagellar biosynthesis protein FlgA [Fodinicurvata sp. CAU 1616]MDF2096463.1 flagellar biosynthesis protein FlgA [Fodinicurvata sp. CAU 1616]
MNLQALLPAPGARPVEVALVGAGEFGRTFLSQVRRVAGMRGRVVCDRDGARAVETLRAIGIAEDDIRRCDSAKEASEAFEAGRHVVVEDSALLLDLPLSMVVEATGIPEAAAAIAEGALANGMHVAMVTKEAESVVGPLLGRRAHDAGLVYTPVDGDQPSLLIGLVGWCQLLGLDVLSAGKASEYDFVYDPASDEVSAQGRSVALPEMRALWDVPSDRLADSARQRAALLADFWHRTVPDLCEMTIVANATGLLPDAPALHAPIARTVELPDLFGLQSEGGLTARRGSVDIFNCLRRPDELSFAGGVYVIAAAPDPETAGLFAEKGIPVSADRKRVLVHNPVHLLGAEAPMSVLSACLARKSTGGAAPQPLVDLVARAEKDIPTGTVFELGWRHSIAGLAPEMLLSGEMGGAESALPYYLLPGTRALTDIPAGALVTRAMVAPPEDSVLWRLRAEQDRVFTQ